jgi:hypothetical protein
MAEYGARVYRFLLRARVHGDRPGSMGRWRREGNARTGD